MIAFTLCSNNYLPRARILGESLLRHNPGARFIIGLIDELNAAVDYSMFAPFEILPVHDIGIEDLCGMVLRYSIVELNTAAKPFYFRYLLNRHSAEKELKICYFDPDIEVYCPLTPIEEELNSSTVLLTPHILSPIPQDGKQPSEQGFLNYGLYNLGFCGVRQSETVTRLIEWWSERLAEHCRIDVANGVFVDQLWMNLVPIFFDNVGISRNPGLNAAYWNLHERRIEVENGEWVVNKDWPLVFYHFSDLPLDESEFITKVPSRFSLDERPELRPLFDEYRSKVAKYNIHTFRGVPCAYMERRREWLQQKQRLYYQEHPVRFLTSRLKRAFPKRLKEFIRASTVPYHRE